MGQFQLKSAARGCDLGAVCNPAQNVGYIADLNGPDQLPATCPASADTLLSLCVQAREM
jgi:hypothetical protein